jgi:hypothetical protein
MDAALVRLERLAEISADWSIDHYRHPLRLRRLRLDVELEGVPLVRQASAAAAG